MVKYNSSGAKNVTQKYGTNFIIFPIFFQLHRQNKLNHRDSTKWWFALKLNLETRGGKLLEEALPRVNLLRLLQLVSLHFGEDWRSLMKWS